MEMSGFEAPLVAAGSRLLGTLAAEAIRRLTRNWSSRWSVWLMVRKSIPVKFSARAYRRWLKNLTIEVLQTPAEEACSSLAKQLDELLITHGKGWDENNEHLSHALRLVEVTFPAIV